MMDEEIRQALNEVREMKKMCGNINMKLTNIVTQRGQDWKAKLEAEYQRGLEDGKQTAVGAAELREKLEYQRGLDDAWECAGKLFSSMADSDIEKAFPTEWNNGGFHALINLQPQEAIEKLKAYEEKQKADDKIDVGDEVTPKKNVGWKGVVVGIDDDNAMVMTSDGYSAMYQIEILCKTGRHFDIASILEDMRND